jgi:biopolymer transport protein ExbB
MKVSRFSMMSLGVAGALAGAGNTSFADEAVQKGEEALGIALEKYTRISNENGSEEAKLIEEVELLDDEVLKLSKQLRALESEEALATRKKAQLQNELEKRETEFGGYWSNFAQYRAGLINRLHVSESQHYDQSLAEMKRSDEAADNHEERVKANAPVLLLGAKRLLEVAGGHGFEGKAAGPGNTLEEGAFALFGPVGFFAGSSGEVAGMTAFQAGDVSIPSILPMSADDSTKVIQLVRDGASTVPVDPSLGKAFQIEEGKKTVAEFLRGGGYVGYAILVFGIMGGTLALFKLVEILRFEIPTRKTVNEILDKLIEGEAGEGVSLAERLPGIAGRVVEAGARHFHEKRRVLEDALYEKMSAVQPRLERLLPFLAVIAAAAPMAGLLGTVLGIMKTFEMMAEFGTGDAKVTAGGIGEALITTFLGLLVAIPMIMIHGVLKSLARTRLGKVEGIAFAMFNATTGITGGVVMDEDQDEDFDDGEGQKDLTLKPA